MTERKQELTKLVLTPNVSREETTKAVCAAAKHVIDNQWSHEDARTLFEALGFIPTPPPGKATR